MQAQSRRQKPGLHQVISRSPLPKQRSGRPRPNFPSAASQIASGRSRIEAAKNTIMEQEASLTQAEAELADGRAELGVWSERI